MQSLSLAIFNCSLLHRAVDHAIFLGLESEGLTAYLSIGALKFLMAFSTWLIDRAYHYFLAFRANNFLLLSSCSDEWSAIRPGDMPIRDS